MIKTSTLAAKLFSAILLCASGYALFKEMQPFIAGAGDRAVRFENTLSGANQSGLSTFSQQVALDTCVEMVTSPYGVLQPASRRSAVAEICKKEALSIIQRSPANAYAWYATALFAAKLNDNTGLNTGLAQSRKRAPNEQWLAERRAELAEGNFALLDTENQAGNANDLKLLVQSRRGIRSIAFRWARTPAFRERITAIVETLPNTDQQRFLKTIRAVVQDLNPPRS